MIQILQSVSKARVKKGEYFPFFHILHISYDFIFLSCSPLLLSFSKQRSTFSDFFFPSSFLLPGSNSVYISLWHFPLSSSVVLCLFVQWSEQEYIRDQHDSIIFFFYLSVPFLIISNTLIYISSLLLLPLPHHWSLS